METKIFTRMPYCLLCGEKFNSSICFRSIIPADPVGDFILTEPMDFRGGKSTIILAALDIEIQNPKKCWRIFRPAPSTHSICWTAVDHRPCLRFLYNLGLSMNPLVWQKLPQSIHSHCRAVTSAIHLLLFSAPPAGDKNKDASLGLVSNRLECNRTTLYILMKHIGNLPLELVSIIWKLTPPSATRSLLALLAAKTMWPASYASSASALVHIRGDILVYLAPILDGVYITGICIDGKLYGYQSSRSRRLSITSATTGFTFTLGRYGLRSIEDLLSSEKPLKSLARENPEYTGVVYGKSPPVVELTWDVWNHSSDKFV
ncbi:hypothetical protein BO82DRAFT_94251 [Aspergillus uvarum CBS 121591]|uniref:Uncharacterized protein n=1 Tax=Aspergillus uvarum CBS 121591 TaxID=1448315 RepID=A0A319CB84_9EURO|nr:hypothetical protein BO82DRAFT_94251 [Aspergillus uvarum CBS 121591]PYH81379.1 hypothetical protein BO82DRAFT_94251 [Aspergillus uvarum CBS 121591]